MDLGTDRIVSYHITATARSSPPRCAIDPVTRALTEQSRHPAGAQHEPPALTPIDTGFTTITSYDVRFSGYAGERVPPIPATSPAASPTRGPTTTTTGG